MNNNSSESQTDLTEIFGEPISIYTRAQALADGLLVDVSPTAREAGWHWPVAITSALWSVIETIPPRHSYQSVEGRLWDVVWMASRAARRSTAGVDRVVFELILLTGNSRRQYQQLVCHVGPGDEGEPVVTIGYAEDF